MPRPSAGKQQGRTAPTADYQTQSHASAGNGGIRHVQNHCGFIESEVVTRRKLEYIHRGPAIAVVWLGFVIE